MVIRPFHKEDIRSLQDIIRATGVFKEEEVAVAVELMEIVPEEKEQSDYVLFTAVDDANIVRGYYCIGPTPMTEGTFDLYWIAVDPMYHGKGMGKQLLQHCEDYVKVHNGRLIVAETSSQALYDNTRKFYLRCNYIEASRIKDYYSVGDDLVVYTKHL